MGYLRFIRVATCCIVIQVVLTVAHPATEKNTYVGPRQKSTTAVAVEAANDKPGNENTNDSPKQKSSEGPKPNAFIERDLGEPGAHEDTSYSYHKTSSTTENTQDDGKTKLLDSKNDVHKKQLSDKNIKYKNNKFGKEVDTVGNTVWFNDHDYHMVKTQTKGSNDVFKRTESDKGNYDVVEKIHSTNEDVDNGSVRSDTSDHEWIENGENKVREYHRERKDDKNIKAHRLRNDEYNNKETHRKIVRDGSVQNSPDMTSDMLDEKQTATFKEHKFTDRSYATEDVTPDTAVSYGEVRTYTTDTDSDVKQQETTANRETPDVAIRTDDLTKRQNWLFDKKWNVEDYKTENDKSGATATYNKTEGNSNRKVSELKGKNVTESSQKTGQKTDTTVTAETYALVDHGRTEEKKQTEIKKTTANGGIKKEQTTEEREESYNVRKVEPVTTNTVRK